MGKLICVIIAFIAFDVPASDNRYNQLLNSRSYYKKQVEQVQIDMTVSALRHPGATAALIASGSGVAAMLMDHMDAEEKGAILFASLFGVGYCVNHTEECKLVARDLTIHAALLAKYQSDLSRLTGQIARYRSLRNFQ